MLTKGEFPELMRKHKNEGKTSCFGWISPCLRERVAWRKEFIITSSSGIPAFDLSGHPWSTQLVRDDPDDTGPAGFGVGGKESRPRRFRDATVHEEMEETKRSEEIEREESGVPRVPFILITVITILKILELRKPHTIFSKT